MVTALVPEEIAPVMPTHTILTYQPSQSDANLDESAFEDVEFYVPAYMASNATMKPMERMPKLRVCQLLSAGYENAVRYVPEGVTLCKAAGVHDTSTAELAVALMLTSLRGIDDAVRNMAAGHWARIRRPSLADRRVVVVGAGGIGRAIQRRLHALEAEVQLVGRTAREDVAATGDLAPLLAGADIVVIAVPLDASTEHLVDAGFLAAMPDNSLLVNVARGQIVDTEALVAEVSAGRLRAALDVTDPEPLPAEHVLWRLPGVVITPHVGGDTSAFPPRARLMIERQIEALAEGRPLRGVVRTSRRAQ